MPEITAVMMDDHAWFRRQFARLDDAHSPDALREVWSGLSARLEVHARAEETIFYPALLRKGGGDAKAETKDAVRDHNKIRAAIQAAREAEVGSEPWKKAVHHARTENSEHMTEEEDEGFPDFRKHAAADLRETLAADWARFYAEHPDARDLPKEKAKIEDVIEKSAVQT